jgi:4,5-dihydroxyphthalate decarboxylase
MRLRYGGVPYDRTLGLMTGAVRPEGVELEYVAGLPNHIFPRVVTGEEFEAGELSASNFLMAWARGERRFVALPVFPSRAFRHDTVYVHVGAGIERPQDLRGRRVGIARWVQTADFWVRGLLAHEYGVPHQTIRWVRGAWELLDVTLPSELDLTDAPPGRDLSDLLDTGEIDALITLERPACFAAGSPNVRRLFPDYRAVEAEYYQRTGHFPIMHLVVLRRDVYEGDRSLARRLYDAFETAKQQAQELLAFPGVLATSLPFQAAYLDETRAVFGDDPFPYGVARNRHTFGALCRYLYEQGVTAREVAVEEAFVPELLTT